MKQQKETNLIRKILLFSFYLNDNVSNIECRQFFAQTILLASAFKMDVFVTYYLRNNICNKRNSLIRKAPFFFQIKISYLRLLADK